MRRRDIRRGTLLICTFYVLVCVVIVLSMVRTMRTTPHEMTELAETGPTWSDSLTNASSDYEPLHRMDSEVQRFMDRWDIKGMSLAVTRNDSLLYAKGYGWADREAGVRMTPTNIMRIASASKLVTAIAIMRLREQGLLSLDSKVFGPGGILGDTAFTAAIGDRRILDITVDNLLHHKGGFGLGAGDPMFNTNEIIAAKHLDGPPSNDQLVRIVLSRRIAFAPGHGRRYSNFGYFLLSLIIERVSGTDYWDYVQREVLRPAGSYLFRPATNYYEARSPGEVRYYGPDNELVEEYNGSGRMVERIYGGSNVNGLMGAGGWCASASDLARLVAATDGHPGVKDIISRESVGLLTQHSDDDKLSRGWSECDAHGKWTRTGTLSSTHTLIERFPNGECWVLVTNSGVWTGHHFSRDMSRLVERLRGSYGRELPRRDLF